MSDSKRTIDFGMTAPHPASIATVSSRRRAITKVCHRVAESTEKRSPRSYAIRHGAAKAAASGRETEDTNRVQRREWFVSSIHALKIGLPRQADRVESHVSSCVFVFFVSS